MVLPVNEELLNTRSMLNPVAPIDVGTPEVESMVSYFCRLAMSHCISTTELHRIVDRTMQWQLSEKYDWCQVGLSGMSDAAERMADALSKLTGIGNLDSLTLLSWRDVIAQSSPKPTSSRWCPQCLSEDRETGRTYFRLAWDVGTVTACTKHKIRLSHACPDCGGTNTRHSSAFVMPGWCTACGIFLGSSEQSTPATPAEVWIASQVGAMLAAQNTLASRPTRSELLGSIREIVNRLDNGKNALFARRIGLSKTTVHHWLKGGGAPTLPGLLRIAAQTGLALPSLLTGDLAEWSPTSSQIHELDPVLPTQTRRATRQLHDWDRIRSQLAALAQSTTVVSVEETARSLNVSVRELYIHANEEACSLGRRWLEHRKWCGEQSRHTARKLIETACAEILAEGKAVNLRELIARFPNGSANRFNGILKRLKEIQEKRNAVELQ